MVARSARRREQLELAATLRAQGRSWSAVAATLRDRYGLNGRVAMRLAHGWAQAEVAEAWNRRWPREPKTFKNISYWETWPASTGHAPSLVVLGRLAELYECDAADLISDWAAHRHREAPGAEEPGTEAETLAWQVGHLELAQLTRALEDWSERLPDDQRGVLLLKLSTSAALAAASLAGGPQGRPGASVVLEDLAGTWNSEYSYFSTGRNTELHMRHQIRLSVQRGRLVGTSPPTPTGAIDLDLGVDGLLVTGRWEERTVADGYYQGAVYRGVLQMMLDPTGRTMTGRWLGPDKEFTVDSGRWTMTRSHTRASATQLRSGVGNM